MEIRCQSPSNIALIKYWGKREEQLPMNASLSMTLSKSHTDSVLTYSLKEQATAGLSFEFYFEGRRNLAFECKVRTWLEKIQSYFPFLVDYDLKINSVNSFPHSSGIASSASSFSSMAMCLCALEVELTSGISGFNSTKQKASFIARLGSGSASRSAYGNFVVWGRNEVVTGASDEYAIPLDVMVHENFKELCDSILVVSSEAKGVSSTDGHRLMLTNPYADLRYKVAELNFSRLVDAMKTGNTADFMNIVENEALNLHAMFLASSPGYFLATAGTIEVIKKIRTFREQTGLFLCFTLDAGPNVHLLYSKSIKSEVTEFIQKELVAFCEKGLWIDDEMGKGPVAVVNGSQQ